MPYNQFIRAILILVLFPVFFCHGQPSNPAKIKVGAVLSLTGDAAVIGNEIKRGMDAAYSRLSSPRFTLAYEDDQSFDKSAAINAVNRLINLHQSPLILNESINSLKAVASVLNRNSIPGIIVWDYSKEACRSLKDIHCFGFGTELAGETMSQYLHSMRKVKKVAVFSVVDEWSEMISAAFSSEARKLGMEITVTGSFDPQESDYRTPIAKAISKGSEALYAPLLNNSFTAFVRQARELGFKGVIASGDGFSTDQIKLLGKEAEGILSTQVWSQDPAVTDLFTSSGQMTDPVSLGFFSLGYDSVNLVNSIFEKLSAQNKPATKSSISAALKSVEFDGVSGRFHSSSFTGKKEPVTEVKEGKFELAL